MKNLICIIVLLLTVNTYAQNSTDKKQYFSVVCLAPNGKPIANEDIQVYSLRMKKSVTKTTDENGRFSVMLPYGWWKFYATRFGVRNLLSLTETRGEAVAEYKQFYVTDKPNSRAYTDVELSFTYEWNEVEIDVKYNSGSAQLLPESNKVLEDVVEYLKRKSNLKIEVAGHTDNVGDPDKNKTLSKQRAESVKSYLMKAGIDASRLTTQGYGDTKPIANNNSESGRAKNRRTEIKIVH